MQVSLVYIFHLFVMKLAAALFMSFLGGQLMQVSLMVLCFLS